MSAAPASWMDQLNPAQRAAATHGDGPVLVIAGAGTGKTRTLASRVAYLIEQGVNPESLLLLTFTRRSAAEMLTRAGQLTGGSAAGRVWGGTFHAMANRLLRQYGQTVGLSPDFTVMDQSDAADLMNLVRTELGYGRSTGRRRFPRKATLLAIYSRAVNSQTKLAPLVEKHYPWCVDELDGIKEIIGGYTKRKRERNVLDYDDLLLFWRALAEAEGVGQSIADRFSHILVDEYQDTNLVQADLLRAMRRGSDNIMVVGDDAQSIYSFRAATVRNILDFPEQFPGCEVVKLEENYRSVQPILNASNAVMAHADHQFDKRLFSSRKSDAKPGVVTCMDEAEQCEEVCNQVLAALEAGVALKQQAVLFRASHHSDALEVELSRRNIPFVKFGGLKFIESAHIKDMLAVLRLLDNPRDELSWLRVLLLLEGVGPVTAHRMVGHLFGRAPAPGGLAAAQADADAAAADAEGEGDAGTDIISPLRRLLDDPPTPPPAAREQFESFCAAVRDCADSVVQSPAAQVERIRKFYDPIFQHTYDNPTVRLRDVEQLEQIAAGYQSRTAFVTDLTLDPPNSTQDLAGPPLLDEDYLNLSTIHSAKGCEWQSVSIIHAADGMMPSDMATGSPEEIDEERRLLYVAMTRAKDTLNLYMPLKYYFRKRKRDNRHSYAQLTRFIPEKDLVHYDRRAAARAREQQAGGGAASRGPAVADAAKSVDAMLEDLLG